MARRRHKRFGDPTAVHAERAKFHLREIKRLTRTARSYLASPPDCESAGGLIVALAQMQGSYLIDRTAGGFRRAGGYGGAGPRGVIRKFLALCTVKPRSASAARKMRAVWRRGG
jgi:hypothetical protein